MRVLRAIRALPEAIGALTGAIHELVQAQSEAGPAADRLEELELSRAKWEAEVEALVLKADSSYKAAANAENRARTMVRSYEKTLPLGFDEDSDPEETRDGKTDPGHNAARGEEEGVLPMRVGVETAKSAAVRAKWGIS